MAQFQSHANVLCGREGLKQVMGLENEANPASKLLHGFGARPNEGLTENLQPSFLDASQRTEQGQQGGFSRTARAGHDDDFTWVNRQVVIEENLFSQLSHPEIMTEALGAYRRGLPE